MNDYDNYINNFFTFNNPFFYAVILSAAIITILIFVYFKYIFPLQKKLVLENNRYLIEKAELMALFAEMDPDPLIRIDAKGNIIQTNEESRKIFPDIEKKGKTIKDFLPSFNSQLSEKGEGFIETIDKKIYSIFVKKKPELTFQNIYMNDITDLKNYEYLQEINRRRLKLLSDKLDNEIEELKSSLAAELHDDIGQRLIMIKLKLSDPNKLSCEEINNDIDFIYNRIRIISRSLRPSDIGNLGLKISLTSLIESVSKNSGIINIFDFYGSEEGIGQPLLTCIYRIIQEALNNIVKHSQAKEFSIQIRINEDIINIIISDDGCGIPIDYFILKDSKIFGTGLFGMKERIEKFNGKLKIDSDSEMGTNLFIEIPREIIN
jgi:signal transduction histidine kinase